MVRSDPNPLTIAVRLDYLDRPRALAQIVAQLAEDGGTIRTFSTVRRWKDDSGGSMVEVELEVEGLSEIQVLDILNAVASLRACRLTRALDQVFGKRLIVIGGGAQIAQAVLGAVSEADRHNLRGEKISVDTIPLVGEENLAAAVRAVADLDRASRPASGWFDNGRRHHRGRQGDPGSGHSRHLLEHGRDGHRGRRPGRHRSGSGRHHGRHGYRRHGEVRLRPQKGRRY